mgnify:CR=1 FL=1
MRVALVTPPYHAGVVESAGCWPHLGFVYIAGALRAAGHEPAIYDAMSRGHNLAHVRAELRRLCPDVVALSAKTPALYAAMDVLRLAKEEFPTAVTVVCADHPTFC